MEARRHCPLQDPKGKKLHGDEIRRSRRPLEISSVIWTTATNPAASDNIISIYFKIFLSLNILLWHSWPSHSFTFTQKTGSCKLIMPSMDVVGIGEITINCLRNACWTVTTDLQLSNCKTQNPFCSGVAICVIIVARETKQRRHSLAQLKLSSILFIWVYTQLSTPHLRDNIITWNCYILLCTLCI